MLGQHTLKILQQNVRKSYPSMLEIFAVEENLKFEIIAIQEPWRNNQYNSTYNPDRTEATRTALYVNRDIALASWSVVHYNIDFSTLRLKSADGRIIYLHNIYNPGPGTPGFNNSVAILDEKLREHPE